MIPKCFIEDIINCIDYYNLIIKPSSSSSNGGLKLDPLNPKQSMTISLIQAYTITNNVNNDLNNIIDIIDIDKLLRNVNRLIKFRNNYNHIQQSWKLFVMSCCSTTNIENDRHIENYKLTLPDLKTIKTNLNLDNPQTNESFLIDMLSCCTHDSNGHILNFDYTKNKHGPHISIKDFAEILGNLGSASDESRLLLVGEPVCKSFHESQTKLIDRLIPEIGSQQQDEITQNEININSAIQFDELLSHLETSFKTNTSLVAPSSSSSYEYLACPSPDVLRVLFTLASRAPNTNWTSGSSNLDGIVTSNEVVKSVNIGYDTSLYRTSLNERSGDIIRNYVEIIITGRISDIGRDRLYGNICEFLGDFITTRPTSTSSVSGLNGRPMRKAAVVPTGPAVLASSPTKKRDIMTIIRESPKKKKKNSDIIIPESELVIISDSEQEESVNTVKKENKVEEPSISAMEKEVQKYQDFGLSINNKPANMFEMEDRGNIKNPFLLLNDVDQPSKKSRKDQQQQQQPVVKDKWDHIRIFDEVILSKKLKPTNFTLWKLVNWAMYCAGKDRDIFDSNYRNCHLIYSTHNSVLSCIFSIIEYNLVEELTKLSKHPHDPLEWIFNQSENIRRSISQQIESNSDILLSVLMTQLSYFKRGWYDRLIENVFNGFTTTHSSSSSSTPTTCYEHEKFLLRDDESIKQKTRLVRYNYFNDLMDSMKLRFKITNMVFYWSYFFDFKTRDGIIRSKSESSIGNSLSPTILIKEIASRFINIECYYLEEFFQCMFSPSVIPQKYHELFLINLSQEILEKLTNSFQLKFNLCERLDNSDITNSNNDLDWRRNKLRLVLNWIINDEIYEQITEDETYPSFAHFNQAWLKLNFLLGWMLGVVLRDVKPCLESLDIDSLLNTCVLMDERRIEKYRTYLTQVGIKKFSLSQDEVKEKMEKQKWENFKVIMETSL
ncbi:uncharacterized protein J8A68_000784 [[Candida] subhashii]|uniref:Uncharacterized protein n=1 Tax=[Candida] subhashii TaxID=561895 RepID=A0A8J5V573_9ASCO|nr:uncharacterized protein J8A68_000784 [[Candida] subhashii]KAG7665764.1 hypothetical protein J8A68_000784 [[Candida] subhashii]